MCSAMEVGHRLSHSHEADVAFRAQQPPAPEQPNTETRALLHRKKTPFRTDVGVGVTQLLSSYF